MHGHSLGTRDKVGNTMTWWELLLLIPLGLGMLVGLAGSVLPLLPGPPLILACAIGYAWITGFEYLGPSSLILLAVLVLATIVLDQLAGAWGAARAGASKYAVGIALVFGLVGFCIGPLWLAFVLPILAVAIVELAMGKAMKHAIVAAGGVGVGNIANALLKLTISVLMIIIVIAGLVL